MLGAGDRNRGDYSVQPVSLWKWEQRPKKRHHPGIFSCWQAGQNQASSLQCSHLGKSGCILVLCIYLLQKTMGSQRAGLCFVYLFSPQDTHDVCHTLGHWHIICWPNKWPHGMEHKIEDPNFRQCSSCTWRPLQDAWNSINSHHICSWRCFLTPHPKTRRQCQGCQKFKGY